MHTCTICADLLPDDDFSEFRAHPQSNHYTPRRRPQCRSCHARKTKRTPDGFSPPLLETRAERDVHRARLRLKIRKPRVVGPSLPGMDGVMGIAPPEPEKPFQAPSRVMLAPSEMCPNTSDIEEMIAAHTTPERVLYTNEHSRAIAPTTRRSKGALSREEKERRRQAYEDGVRAQQANLAFEQLPPMTPNMARTTFLSKIRGRGQSNSGKMRPPQPERQDPWRLVRLTNHDLDRLYREALAKGYVFLARPEGWRGQWPFAPSPDKIDPTGNYTVDNLQMVPWIENRARGDAFRTIVERYIVHRSHRLGVVAKEAKTIFARLQELGGLTVHDRNAVERVSKLAQRRGLISDQDKCSLPTTTPTTEPGLDLSQVTLGQVLCSGASSNLITEPELE